MENLKKSKCDKSDSISLKRTEEFAEPVTEGNIPEMIEKCEYDPNLINNPKTKKQIQILLSRNGKEEKQYQKKLSSIEQSDIKDCKNGETSTNNFESEEKCVDKSRFEEIENKLEEMFAGIEDEHLTSIPAAKRSNDFALNFNEEVKSKCETSNMDVLSSNCYSQGVPASNKSALPTKAAMKSTVSFSKNVSTENEESKNKSKSFQHLRTVPIRRRLSIEIESELFKFPTKNEKTNYEFQNVLSEDAIKNNSGTSKKSSLQKSKIIKVDTPKYKINKNNRKCCIEYKGKKRNNKQQKKSDISNIPKHKVKHGQRLLPSDNDEELEEKTQQAREIDNKNRSPFILVNANGNVTVVNTLMQDEFHEKYTKTKISKSYGFERKTVKGCHSSTLSNRYDADKADSSWICVFCKNGPHKKGLGDLFGPYIVSTDCDEYQTYKDLKEYSPKNGNAVSPFFSGVSSNGSTLYNKTVKHLYDNSIKAHTHHELDMPKHAENHPIPSYSLGMIKISECSYEVWIHEDCAIWAPNIFIIGSRLAGLEEATWNSTGHECCYCLKPGALLCCLQRDCKIMTHLPCAREANWLLDESSYLTLCKKHSHVK